MVSYRVLITGSRTWENERLIKAALADAEANNHWGFPMVLIHGTAAGADTIAAMAAEELGWRIEAHPADWKTHGKRAGFVRNAEMVASRADLCLAFIKDNSKGATMCAELAERAGIPTIYYRED